MFISDLLEFVAFRGDKLVLVWKDGEPYAAIGPICDRLGLDRKSQRRKLTTSDSDLRWGHMTLPSAGGPQEAIGLHVVDLPLWLASISPAKVKPEVREALVAYRRECALVLFEHVKGRLLGERDAALVSLSRLREEVVARKPLWTKIRGWMADGLTFEQIWRSTKRPQWMVAEAIDDMMRLGLISAKPAGFPAVAQQLDMFAEG